MEGKTSRAWWAVLSLSLWLQGATVRADAVEAPPADCPAGTRGDTCHGGPFCSPLKCSSDAECTDGATCQDTRGCIGSIECGGGDAGPDPAPTLSTTLSALCEGGEACGARETCQAIKLCLPAVEPTTGGGSASGPTSSGTATSDAGTASGGDDGGGGKGGCGSCSADAGPGASALAVLAIAALVPRRRRGVRERA